MARTRKAEIKVSGAVRCDDVSEVHVQGTRLENS